MAKSPSSTGRAGLGFNALLFPRGQPAYVAFDVLFADGQDLRHLPLAARKAILDDLLHGRTDLVVLDGIADRGVALFRKVCELDLEGIVAKRLAVHSSTAETVRSSKSMFRSA